MGIRTYADSSQLRSLAASFEMAALSMQQVGSSIASSSQSGAALGHGRNAEFARSTYEELRQKFSTACADLGYSALRTHQALNAQAHVYSIIEDRSIQQAEQLLRGM
jgi:hypothetical protein